MKTKRKIERKGKERWNEGNAIEKKKRDKIKDRKELNVGRIKQWEKNVSKKKRKKKGKKSKKKYDEKWKKRMMKGKVKNINE